MTQMTQMAPAAPLATALDGSLTVTTLDSGANYINADGGTSPIVEINAGVILNPDGVNNGINVNSLGYFDPLFNPADPNALSEIFGIRNLGSITGGDSGLNADNNQITLHNAGTLAALGSDGIVLLGDDSVIANSGTIEGIAGGIFSPLSNNVVVHNSGLIDGDSNINGIGSGIVLGDDAIIVNKSTGTIFGGGNGVVLNYGSVTNEGIISGGAAAGDNGIEVIGGGVGGDTFINNSGTISAFQGISIFGADNDQVINSDTITGTGGVAITTGAGDDDVFLDLGSIVNGAIDGEAGDDILTFTGGKTVPLGISNEVHGDVIMEEIFKVGTGTAFIGTSGDPLFTVLTDTINLDSGGLYINGTIGGILEGTQTTIFHDGTGLGGTGTWNANIELSAGAGISAGETPINIDDAVNPLNSIGELTITGDVTHTAGSFIRFDIAPQTALANGVNSDLIIQNGLGNIYDVNGAGIRISPTNINRSINDGTYTIVDSDVVIANFNPLAAVGVQFNNNVDDNGPFFSNQIGSNNLNSVLVSEFAELGLADAGTNLVVTIEHNFSDLDGLTSNQSSLGEAIDQSLDSTDANVQDLIAALDYSDLSTVQQTLASLSPDAYLAQGIAVVNSNYRLHRMTQEHLAAIRRGGMTITTPGSQDAKGGVMSAPSTRTTSSNANVWGAYSHDWLDYSGDDSLSDFDGDTGAFTAGFDWRVAPAWILGIVLDGSSSDFDGDYGDSEVDSFRGAIYGTWGEPRGIYSDFLVGYGTHDMDSSRSGDNLFGLDGDGNTDADSLQALWTIGYSMGNDGFKHGPFVGLEYQNVDVDSFDESGPLPFSVGSYEVESLRGLIGYRMDGTFGKVRPYASITYAHEFEDDRIDAEAEFAGNTFSVDGAAQDSAILLTAGVGFSLSERLSMDVGYRGEISVEDEGLDSHGGSIGLNYSF